MTDSLIKLSLLDLSCCSKDHSEVLMTWGKGRDGLSEACDFEEWGDGR